MRTLSRTLTSSLLGLVLVGSALVAMSNPASAAQRPAVPSPAPLSAAVSASAPASLSGRPCRMKCRIVNRYALWLGVLMLTGARIPGADWNHRQRVYLRHHPGFARQLGPTDIFRHPGKRSFTKKVRTRRDRRHKGIPAEAFAKGGGLNYCSTLTLRRKVESSIFKADLFTTSHKTRWCWDDNVIYDHGDGNWTEVAVHDRTAIINNGEIDHHNGNLPTRGTWYTSQQWSICNCLIRYGAVGSWQPLWQVWAKPGGKFTWDAHW